MTVSAPRPEPTRVPPDPAATRRAQGRVVTLTLALALGTLGYRAIMGAGLDQTAALFVGLPALLAIVVATAPATKTVTGLILRVMTVGLLLSGILLGETLVCLVVAAPLVYLIGLMIGVPVDISRRRRARLGRSTDGFMAVVGLVLLAGLEGVVPGLSFPTDGSVTTARHVAAAPHQVEAALTATPRFDAPLPLPLRVGFPRPVTAWGNGLDVGDTRTVTFEGDDHYGATHIGDLVLTVIERAPGRAVFTVSSDGTRVAQWLRWERAVVTWHARRSGTDVSWRLDYERRLAPAWYFAPVQHAAARVAAGYLIDTLALPDD